MLCVSLVGNLDRLCMVLPEDTCKRPSQVAQLTPTHEGARIGSSQSQVKGST